MTTTTVEEWRAVLSPAREDAWPARHWVVQRGGRWVHADTDRRAVRWDLAAVGTAVLRALGCAVPPTRHSTGGGWPIPSTPPLLRAESGFVVSLRPATLAEVDVFTGRGVA